jgi:hypothetical protein
MSSHFSLFANVKLEQKMGKQFSLHCGYSLPKKTAATGFDTLPVRRNNSFIFLTTNSEYSILRSLLIHQHGPLSHCSLSRENKQNEAEKENPSERGDF